MRKTAEQIEQETGLDYPGKLALVQRQVDDINRFLPAGWEPAEVRHDSNEVQLPIIIKDGVRMAVGSLSMNFYDIDGAISYLWGMNGTLRAFNAKD